MDVSNTIIAKSDQLNADDLMGGPIVVRIERVTSGQKDQPVIVHVSGGHQPWKPCKTMRRLLVALWGVDASGWVGQWVRLYRDPDVRWAGEKTGGIRVDGATIPRGVQIPLTETRGVKRLHSVSPIEAPDARIRPAVKAIKPTLAEVLAANGMTVAELDAMRAAETPPKCPVGELTEQQQQQLADFYAAKPEKLRTDA